VTRRLALIAHDNKKVDLIAWATYNRDTLGGFSLIATRHTARLLRDKVGLDVEELLSGPEGGDAQIAARVAIQSVDAVFFFVDPLSAQPHDPDIRALLRVSQRAQRTARDERCHRGSHHRRLRSVLWSDRSRAGAHVRSRATPAGYRPRRLQKRVGENA
jgi:methylglyoxal synthase